MRLSLMAHFHQQNKYTAETYSIDVSAPKRLGSTMNQSPFVNRWDRPSSRIFSGKYVELAPLMAQRDCAELFQASHKSAQHRAIWDFLWQGPFAEPAAMLAWLTEAEKGADPIFFTVTYLPEKRKIGMISLLNIVTEMGRAELGHIWYAPEVQRSKVNTEAVFLLLDYLLTDLRYRRAEWKCDARNERSRKAAQRLGFSFEGIFRQHMVVKGQNRDTAWFSILDKEWPRLRHNINHWLYVDDTVSLRSLNTPQIPA